MPELPEVEAVARACREDGLVGLTLESLEVLRESVLRPQTAALLDKQSTRQTVVKVSRRAKNILISLENRTVIRVHLRMTGDLRIQSPLDQKPMGLRLFWKLSDERELVFSDSRALGKVHVHTAAEIVDIFANTGIEPLGRDFTPQLFKELAKRSRLPAKLFLMDQTKIAGLGNIYAAEALFRARISPRRPINKIGPARMERLYEAIQEVLKCAVHSVYKAYRSPEGYRNHGDDFKRYVYGRAGKLCEVCGNKIKRISQGGRSTYYCVYCQRQ